MEYTQSYARVFLAELEKRLAQGRVILAIEGGSASGKTTLGNLLSTLYDCALFHTDDFFLQPHQRTRERFAEMGGNLDRERFLEEVLAPLYKGETVRFRKFDCMKMQLGEFLEVQPKKLTVVEGAYSMHPAFEKYYDFSIFLDVEPNLQKERILKRNTPPFAKRFFEEWIPLENAYFTQTRAKERCDRTIPIV